MGEFYGIKYERGWVLDPTTRAPIRDAGLELLVVDECEVPIDADEAGEIF